MATQSSRKGVITAHYGVAVTVRFFDDTETTEMIRVKRNSGHVVGDTVEVVGEILTRLQRQTEIQRMDTRRGIHVVGANLDILCIVTSCEPLPSPGFIDRVIVAARSNNLAPVLIVNKSDLPNSSYYIAEILDNFSASLPIFITSTITKEGISELARFFSDGHRAIFVGASGVGKSSILNAFIPNLALETAEISQSRKRGRHTTTVSTLHTLPDGGEVIDSPGFNDFGLVDIQSEQLALFFPGFEKVLENPCQFRNCKHRKEPGCSIVTALDKDIFLLERYRVYLSLLDEVEGTENSIRYRERRKRRKK